MTVCMVMLALAFSYLHTADEDRLSSSSIPRNWKADEAHVGLRVDVRHAKVSEKGSADQSAKATNSETKILEADGGKRGEEAEQQKSSLGNSKERDGTGGMERQGWMDGRDGFDVPPASEPDGTSAEDLRRTEGLDALKMSLRVWNLAAVPGRLICKTGQVLVYAEDSPAWAVHHESKRSMVFASEIDRAVESVVTCDGAACSPDWLFHCKPCPCKAKMDGTSRLFSEYMRVINRQLEPLCVKKARVLLVGLGGSLLAQYLAHNCRDMKIDVFEVNKDVVEAAQNFFGLREAMELHNGTLSVSTVDAAEGLQQLASCDSPVCSSSLTLAEGFVTGPGAYDAVVIDCFTGMGKTPDACRSRETLESVRTVLRPEGILLQNVWDRSNTLPEVAHDFVELTIDYKTVFPQFEDLRVPMPPGADIVHILKGTKEDTKTTRHHQHPRSDLFGLLNE